MGSETGGLTSEEAKKQLEKFGPNVLPEKQPPSALSIFLSQLKSPLVYILLIAALVTFFLGDYTDFAIILFAVLINTILGFFQERRASQALNALKKLIHPKARVVRDGAETELAVENIVPGDLIVLNQGDKVSADGVLVEANRMFLEEAILTGEASPLTKVAGDKVFFGTIVTAGRGKFLVKSTGEETEIGKIAEKIQEKAEDTPLRRQLKNFSRQLTYLVFGLTLFVFVVGLLKGFSFVEIFTISVALAVSSIPEGLLVGLTVVLAIGMQRILARHGLVRKLVSAETLGGVTTICVDKTGTLTEGHMSVIEVIGDKDELSLQALIANDLDDPLVIAAHEWALENRTGRDLLKKFPRLDSIPFSSKERFFACLNKWDPSAGSGHGQNIIFVNGAPEFLLDWSKLSSAKKKETRETIEHLTSEGRRIVGMARKVVSADTTKITENDCKGGLEWIGLLSFSDPVRPGVSEALQKAEDAGISILVITGDYPQTAISVMQQLKLKISNENIVLGDQLDKISASELAETLAKKDRTTLFARTTPSQKLKIVEALKKNGEVVAMMGDGVNDAPALSKADIGIVVGEASDVAKESADLVLLNSNFSTIVAAVEEGRGIFENIRKIILYLMSDAFEEIIAVIGTIIIGLPLPVTAAQILWINLVSDGFPHLALTVEPKRAGIMKEPPRNPREALVSKWMKGLIMIVSLAGGLFALGLFTYIFKTTGDEALARSVAFATLGINSLVYVFSIRTLKDSFWEENPFNNKWLNVAVITGLFFQVVPFFVVPLRNFLGLVPITLTHWGIILSVSLVMFVIIEISKEIFKLEHIK